MGTWATRAEFKDIKCCLDGTLIHDLQYPSTKALYASATQVKDTGEIILKAVNTSAKPLAATVQLDGASPLASAAEAFVLTSDAPTD